MYLIDAESKKEIEKMSDRIESVLFKLDFGQTFFGTIFECYFAL
jgi:hypothetical protein